MQSPKQGDTIWAARLREGVPDDEIVSYTLGEPYGTVGGFGKVFKIMPPSGKEHSPPLVAKFFLQNAIDKIRSDKLAAQRVYALALKSDLLHRDLSFCAWPRRVIFNEPKPRKGHQQQALVGFTMAKLPPTIMLEDMLNDPVYRRKLTPQSTIHIAMLIADRLHKLHAHPYNFVFSDISPRNIHVTSDFSNAYFIDTDAYSFNFPERKVSFPFSGTTPPFISPHSVKAQPDRDMLPSAHDDFAFAVLLFQMIMYDIGRPTTPFQCGRHDEADLVAKYIFPMDNQPDYRVPSKTYAAYKTLPLELRSAFTRTFTTPNTVTCAEWITILSKYRRSL